MKLRLFAILFAAFVAALPGSPCGAAVQMWVVNYSCNPPGLPNHWVWRVYCQFTNSGDRLVGVYGNPASPATISGFFYNNPFTGHIAPNAAVIAAHPQALWDTFCTIGLAIDHGDDQTVTSPFFPQWPITNLTNISWSVPPSGYEQGCPDHDHMVLIAQLTIPGGGTPQNFRVGISYRPAGSQTIVNVNNVSYVLLPLTGGDVNHDLQVNINDLVLVLTNWGAKGPGIPDATDDGVINMDDLVLVINNWGLFTGACY